MIMSRIIVNYKTDDGDNMELETYKPIQAKCPILPYFDFPLTHAMYCPTPWDRAMSSPTKRCRALAVTKALL